MSKSQCKIEMSNLHSSYRYQRESILRDMSALCDGIRVLTQNEMFQEQMAQMDRDPRFSGHPGRIAYANRTAGRPRGQSAGDEEGIPDLGIMKTLNSMGKMASTFASSLTAKPNGQGGGVPMQTRGGNYESSVETNPLVSNRDVCVHI
jgi:hypothetical protein